LNFKVNPHVLIPRFDTEILVEKTIAYSKTIPNKKILDIGTGSGAIAIALKTYIPDAKVTATDISLSALDVAKENAACLSEQIIGNNCGDIIFKQQDLFENETEKYNIIVSNPPYIAYDEKLDPVVLKEPHNALFASDNGLEYYKRIFEVIDQFLEEEFLIILEIGSTQGAEVSKLFRKKFANVSVEKDLQGLDRIVIIRS
jgi:release factor glutamine methyltransferase